MKSNCEICVMVLVSNVLHLEIHNRSRGIYNTGAGFNVRNRILFSEMIDLRLPDLFLSITVCWLDH